MHDQLKNLENAQNNRPSTSDRAKKEHPWIWKIFCLTTAVDSLFTGVNAYFSTHETFNILSQQNAPIDELLNKHPFVQPLTSSTVLIGTFLVALFWCFYKASPKFDTSIQALPECCLFNRSQEEEHKADPDEGFVPNSDPC